MAAHSNILAWRVPWTEELGRLLSNSERAGLFVGATNTFTSIMVLRLPTDLTVSAQSTQKALWLSTESEGGAVTVRIWHFYFLMSDLSLFPFMPCFPHLKMEIQIASNSQDFLWGLDEITHGKKVTQWKFYTHHRMSVWFYEEVGWEIIWTGKPCEMQIMISKTNVSLPLEANNNIQEELCQ